MSEDKPRDSTAAARQRRMRQRRKCGYLVVPVEVHPDDLPKLYDLGHLDVPPDMAGRPEIAEAIGQISTGCRRDA